MPGSASRINPPSPSRIQSPSPESRSTSHGSHRSTPVISNSSSSYHRRKALFGFGEPRAPANPETSVPEVRQPHGTTGSVRQNNATNSSVASSKQSNICMPEGRNGGIPNRLPQNKGHHHDSTTRSGSSNNSVAGSAQNASGTRSMASGEQSLIQKEVTSPISCEDSPRQRHRVHIQMNQQIEYGSSAAKKDFDQSTQKESYIEHVHSLRSALSEETIVSDITRNTTFNPANTVGESRSEGRGEGQEASENPRDNTDLSKQKVVRTPVTEQESTNAPSWWLQMFQRLEKKHEKERVAWKEQLHSAKEKKQEYKEELRQNLSSQLLWLEEHLTLPSHILPGIGYQETGSTGSMSPDDSRRSAKHTFELQYHIDGPSGSGLSSAKGVEVTLDAANHVQRLQELEHMLQETNQQHEQDRLEWVRTLEEAASVTQAGEELSVQQQKQLQKLQKEVDRVNKRQKAQMDEKTAVLTELLELTEKQHSAEKEEWQKKLEQLNTTLEKLLDEKNELFHNTEQLKTEFEANKHDMAQQIGEAKQRESKEKQNVEKVKQRVEETLNRAEIELRKADEESLQLRGELHRKEEENSELKKSLELMQSELQKAAQAADDDMKLAEVENKELKTRINAMANEIEKLHRDLHIARQETDLIELSTNIKSPSRRWLEDLDRTTAERDMYRQEAVSLRKEVDGLKQANQNRSASPAGVNLLSPYLPHQQVRSNFSPNASVVSSPSTLHYESGEENDIVMRYREAVEKHSELVHRLKTVEGQQTSDRDLFKLQLEAALAGSQKLEEEKKVLERRIQELTELHGNEVYELKTKVRKLEEDIGQRCDQLFEISESGSNGCKEEIHNLKKKLKEAEEEMEYRCDQLVEKNYLEVSELKEKLNEVQRERTRAMNEVRKLHEAQRGPRGEDLPSQLKATEEENRNLNLRINELTKSLNEYKSLHSKAVKRFDLALTEKSRLNDELDAIRSNRNIHVPQSEIVNRIDSHQASIINAVDELRTDIASVSEVITGSAGQGTEGAHLSALRADLINIQNTLNDAVAELTLEADALIQSRDAIQNAALSVNQSVKDKNSDLERHERMMKEQQQHLMNEFNVLRENVTRVMEKQQQADTNDETTAVTTSKLVADLLSKEAALASAQTELRFCKEKLETEIAARKSTEADLATLSEQTEILEEEVVTLRSANAKLIKKLRTAGMKIDAALLVGRMSAFTDDTSTVATPRSNMTIRRDDSFAVLDEALALATGLSDIVGQGQRGDTSTMEMLESMHGLIDISESRSPVTTPTSFSPRLRNRKIFDTESGAIEIIHEAVGAESADNSEPSTHLQRPEYDLPLLKLPSSKRKVSELQLVVEQLYGRCEILERERIEIMEATLDLLESARNASSSDLATALATARRRAAAEVQRIHDQNYRDQERIFHRLCTQLVNKGKHNSDSFGGVYQEDQENNRPRIEPAGHNISRPSV